MRAIRGLFVRLLSTFSPARREREIADELESHLQLHIDENLRAGMTADEARRRALVALGGIEATKDAYRDRGGLPTLDAILRDLRFGARMLARNPGFSVAAVVILGLGIGANTAIFSLVNAVVLRPLPFSDSARIMRVWHVPPKDQFSGRPIFAVSPANYLDWRAQNHVFERMAVYWGGRVNLTGQGEPDALIAASVSADFFPILGVRPILGRMLGPGDDEAGRQHVAVLSEGVWASRFGADPAIVGRSIALNGEAYTVVGVVPQRVVFPRRMQLWIPLVWTPEDRAVRGNHNYLVIAELARGVSVGQAQAELTTISKRLEAQYPADDKGWGALVLPLHQDMVGDVRTPLLVLLGAVGFVLLIACANLANLMLARTVGRSRELALRTALGAGRARIVQQLLVESVLLGAIGGAVGLLSAQIGIGALVASIGKDLPRTSEIDLDGRVLLFTAAVALLTGLFAGAAPAWRLTRRDPNESLKQGSGRGGSETGERRVRNALVVSEVALALMLLVGAGLLIRTVWQLQAVDAGIDPHNLLTMTVTIPRAKYPNPDQQERFFEAVLDRIRQLPGVESASATDSLPLQGGSTQPVAIEGEPHRPLSEQPEVAVRSVMPGYLQTARMHLIGGREFTAADRPDRTPVVLVSASMARRFWAGASPIGRHLTLGLISDTPREVVGVVSDVKLEGLDVREPVAAVYVPIPQSPTPWLSLVVRTAEPPARLAPSVVNAIHVVDPEQPALDVLTMDEVIGASLAQQRFAMRLLTTFAAIALVLAAIGTYSVLTYTVRQRVREIGIRMALGAPAGGVVRMVVVEGMKPTLVGLAIGIASAAALGRVLTTLIFGVSARDAATFAAVSAIIVAVGLLSSLLPAYRATRIDPLDALRAE